MIQGLQPVVGPEPRWSVDLGEAARAFALGRAQSVVGTANGELWRFTPEGEVDARLDLGSPIVALTTIEDPSRVVVTTEARRLLVVAGRPWEVTHEVPLERWGETLAGLPDGNVAVGVGREVLRVDLLPTPRVTRIGELASTPTGLGVSRDHQLLAASAYGGVATWHLKTGVRRDLVCKGSMVGLSWSPDGKVIACPTQERELHFWRMPLGQDGAMSGYLFKPTALAWNRKGTLLAVGGAPEVSIWRFSAMSPEGTRPLFFQGHVDEVTALAFHPERDLVASACRQGLVLVHDAQRIRTPWTPRDPFAHGPIVALDFGSGRRLTALSRRGRLMSWDLQP